MRLYAELDARLRSEDISQILSLFLLFMVLGLVFSWTGNAMSPNDSWYTVTAINRTGLALLAVYLGLKSREDTNTQQLASYLVLLSAALVTVPIALITFATSHPAASLSASLAFDVVFPLALFGICLLSTRLLPRAPWLSIPICLAIVALAVATDELIHYRLVSPITILGASNWPLVIIWAVPAVAVPVLLMLAARKET